MKFIALFFVVCSTLFADPYPVLNYQHLIGMKGFSDELLQMHFKLYEGYVKNANELLAKLALLSEEGKAYSYEYGALKRRVGWEWDGMRLHELYFDNLGGTGAVDNTLPLIAVLIAQFGSYEGWKKDFVATGLMRGIGWAILYYDPMQKRLVNCWINEHDLGHLADGKLLLIMDVFEHAYMPQYGLNRAQYIDAFFSNINWDVVSSRYPANP